jgi:tetratricopeptide (TPR) repeat protein
MIDFPTARVSALQQIAAAEITSGSGDAATGHLDRAVDESADIEHEEERIRALVEIGGLYLEAKRNDKAVVTFAEARGLTEGLDNQHRDQFLAACALGFLHAGSSELAEGTLDQVTDKTQMASALLAFSREYWKKGEQEDALDALDEAQVILRSQKEKEIRDSRSRNALLTSVAVQFAGYAKNDRAVESALEIVDPTERVSALTQISKVFAIRKEADLARQTIDLIDEDADRLEAFVAIADAEEELGNRETAGILLDEAAQLAETVPQLSVRSTVMNEIALRLAKYGEPDRAKALANQNLAVITQIRNESSRSAALAGLASVFQEAGLELGESEIQVLRRLTIEN